MKKISPQSKSFIVLVCLAFAGVYACLLLWSDLTSGGYRLAGNPGNYVVPIDSPSQAQAQATATTTEKPVDTSAWKTYTDKKLGLSFKYRPDWKVLPAQSKNGFTSLQIDPGAKYYNIKIYVSPKDYYIMGGLPAQTDSIGGQTALNVSGLLYGVQANGIYYTFDVGLSLSLKPAFDALVHSVTFNS